MAEGLWVKELLNCERLRFETASPSGWGVTDL